MSTRKFIYLVIIITCLVTGCGIEQATRQYNSVWAIRLDQLNTGSVKNGISKEYFIGLWGKPDGSERTQAVTETVYETLIYEKYDSPWDRDLYFPDLYIFQFSDGHLDSWTVSK